MFTFLFQRSRRGHLEVRVTLTESAARFVTADARRAVVATDAAVVDVDAVDARQAARDVSPAAVALTVCRAQVVNILDALAVS